MYVNAKVAKIRQIWSPCIQATKVGPDQNLRWSKSYLAG
jgi:hypothetical protein